MLNELMGSCRHFFVVAPVAIGIGFCMTLTAAADYRLCTYTAFPSFSVSCTPQSGSPPANVSCGTSNECYARGTATPPGWSASKSTSSSASSKVQSKQGDRELSAVGNNTTGQTTLKKPKDSPPPGALKAPPPSALKPAPKPCPTPGRC
jgi:hypothetical protein